MEEAALYLFAQAILHDLRNHQKILSLVRNDPNRIQITRKEHAYGLEINPPMIVVEIGGFYTSLDPGPNEGIYPYPWPLPWRYKGYWEDGTKKYEKCFAASFEADTVIHYWSRDRVTERGEGTQRFVLLVRQDLFRLQYWMCPPPFDTFEWNGITYDISRGLQVILTLKSITETIEEDPLLYRASVEALGAVWCDWRPLNLED